MRTQRARPPSWKRPQSSYLDSVPRNGAHIALLYKSRAHTESGTTPKGVEETAARSSCVRPQIERLVCSTIAAVEDGPMYRTHWCLPKLRVRSSRSNRKWSSLDQIMDKISHRTGSYERPEDRWRLDKRQAPNGAATSYLAVINTYVCRNEQRHARAEGSEVQP